MSDISQTNDTCPKCTQPQVFTLYRSVNVTLNPELKGPLLQQQLTRHVCTACQETITLGIELLYHDMTKGQMIQIEFEDVPERRDFVMGPLLEYQLRKVGSMQALIEKICISDNELDDRVMEVLKVVLCNMMLARYGETLEKLQALPINVSNLVFLKKAAMRLNVEGKSEEGTPQEQLMFLYLLPLPFPMNAICILTPLSAYEQYRNELNSKLENIAGNGKWHRIDFPWANQLLGQKITPVEMSMMMSPGLFESDPIAEAMIIIHNERIEEHLKAMGNGQGSTEVVNEKLNPGTWGRLKKWMGW